MLAVALATVLVAGGAYLIPRVFNNGDHVQIRVDGRLISAQSGQSTVGALLKEQKVTVGASDRVEPSRTSSLSDGMTVRVLRAFPVNLDVDGTARVVYTAYSIPHDFVASLKLPANVALPEPAGQDPVRFHPPTPHPPQGHPRGGRPGCELRPACPHRP